MLVSHTRAFVFVDFAELTDSNLLTRVFYIATGFHHQAVMVFFVLSGYFVGGTVLHAVQLDCFSWKRYAAARLVRLWVVLLPALILTGLFDSLGAYISPDAYAGAFHGKFQSGPTPAQPASLTVSTFLGNLVFLQTIFCPTYGTNGPLWSLANEFWYYVLFPLGLTTIYSLNAGRKRRTSSILTFVLTAIVLWLLPTEITKASTIWLMGVAVWIAGQNRGMKRSYGRKFVLFQLGFGVMFVATLAASKLPSIPGADYFVGLTFALWMPFLLGPWPKSGWWRNVSIGLSEISYSLYVTHFPFLFFASSVVLRGKQYHLELEGLSYFVGLVLGSLVLAYAMWWLFECNTAKIRRRIVIST